MAGEVGRVDYAGLWIPRSRFDSGHPPQSMKDVFMSLEERVPIAEDRWRRIAITALADLQAIGMELEDYPEVDEDVLRELDQYMWERTQ